MATNRKIIPAGPFEGGMDSISSDLYTSPECVVCAYNALNRGGIYQTRPGHSILYDADRSREPRGATLFAPSSGAQIMVKVLGNKVSVSKYPYTTWSVLSGITLDDSDSPAFFAECVYNLKTNLDGSLTVLTPPQKLLIIQTGKTRAMMYDGQTIRFLDPVTECPIGTIMKWIGDRLWLAVGKQLHVSNLLEPIQFSEEQNVAGGGFFTLPDDVTGMGVTANLDQLLVFTSETTTTFSASILDRTRWGATPGFQSILFPNIGCVAPKTVVNQYGLLWWLAASGLMNLNAALIAYRDTKIHYKDEAMARSKTNISDNVSRACAGAFGNILVLSVPSGDNYNFHTWVMDNAVMSEKKSPSVAYGMRLPPTWASIWTGTRPVEWITGTINGHTRCFHLSRDRVNLSSAPSSNMWESFIGEREDYGVDANGNPTVTPIVASIETKYLGGGGFCSYDYAEIFVSEIEQAINLQGSYASRHSGYKRVLNKNIVAETNSMVAGVTLANPVGSYLRQRRRVRMANDVSQATDNDGGVEDIYTRNKDNGFSLLVRWVGRAAIDRLELSVLVLDDIMIAAPPEDETTARYVDADGDNAIVALPLTASNYPKRTTVNVSSITSRYSEEIYASL